MSQDYWYEYTVTVEGANRKWLKRLHRAGLVYLPSLREWERTGLSEQQAKSLVGRMRAEGLKVLLHFPAEASRKLNNKRFAAHIPTPYEQQVLDRIEAEHDKKSRDEAIRYRRHLKRAIRSARNLTSISARQNPEFRASDDTSAKSKPRPRAIGD